MLKKLALTVSAALVAALLVAIAWRQLDRRADSRAWRQLVRLGASGDRTFDPAMVSDLPEPARRYFAYVIEAGARLHTVVELEMTGELGRGSRDDPNYSPMRARQILAPPHGLVWQLRAGPLSGSDGALPSRSWTRFWLFQLIPIVRVAGEDHRRSAFGRVVAEAAFWAPASLLPSQHVRWEAIDENCARAVVRHGALEQAVDITVGPDGAPTRVLIQRWSDENADRRFREQPFGGTPSAFRCFGGYRLPTHVEGGNHFGTPDYFPFFKADVHDVSFPSMD